MFWSKPPVPSPPVTLIDSCADIKRPYSALFGPVTIDCKVTAIKYEKLAPGTKPELVFQETVEEYSLTNTHPLVVHRS